MFIVANNQYKNFTKNTIILIRTRKYAKGEKR